MEPVATTLSSTEETTINYPLSCKIVDNVVISDKAPLYEKEFSIGQLLFEKLNSCNPNFIGQIDTNTNKAMTFAEIKERSIKCALWLISRGVEYGDVIGIYTFNNSDSVIVLLGCLFIGARVYPSMEEDVHQCRYFASLMKPKIIFVNTEMASCMEESVEEEDLNVELVTYTDIPGYQSFQRIIEKQDATAINKFHCTPITDLDEVALFTLSSEINEISKMAIMISHRALINNMLYDNSFAAEDQKIIMHLNNFQWFSSMIVLLQSIYFCKTRIVCCEFTAELICKLIVKYNIDWVCLEGPLARRIKKLVSKYHLSSLRKMVICNAGMVRHLQKELVEALPHTEVIFIYKMKEIYGVNILQGKVNSNGYMINNAQLKVIDVEGKTLGPYTFGEFLWKSPFMMTGYYKNSRATKAVLDDYGWLHSGEFGHYDKNGEIYIRERDISIRGTKGYISVYPSEIETVFLNQSVVYEVGVVSVPHASTKEHMIAFVTKFPNESTTAKKLEDVIAASFDEDYKPFYCEVIFLDILPHTRNGKIAYDKLKTKAESWVRVKESMSTNR